MEGKGRVLLLQAEWPARALLKAELEDRGFDVLGADTPSLAVDLSTERGFSPDLLVVDAVDLALEPGEVERLLFLRGDAPLLLITSGQYTTPTAAALAATREISRPQSVGQIADAAERLVHHQ